MAFPVRFFATCLLTLTQTSTVHKIVACLLTLTQTAAVHLKRNTFFSISSSHSCEIDPQDDTCVREYLGMVGRCLLTIRNLVTHAENEYVTLVAIHLVAGRKQSLSLYWRGVQVANVTETPPRGRTVYEWAIQKRDVIRWRAGGLQRFRGRKLGMKLCLRAKKAVFDIQGEGSAYCAQDFDWMCVVGWNFGSQGRCVVRVHSLPKHHYAPNEMVVASSNSTGIVTLLRDGVLVAPNAQGDWPILVGDELQWRANETMTWRVCLRSTAMQIVTRNDIFSIDNDAASCSVDPYESNCVHFRNFAASRRCRATIHHLPFKEPVFATPSSLRVEKDDGLLFLHRGEMRRGLKYFATGMDVDFWWPAKVGDSLMWVNLLQMARKVSLFHHHNLRVYNASNPAWKVCLMTQRPTRSFFFKEQGPCVVDPDEPTCVERRNYGGKEECVVHIMRLPAHSANESVALRPVFFETDIYDHLRLVRGGKADSLLIRGKNITFEWTALVGDKLEWTSDQDRANQGWRLCLRIVAP